LSGAALLLKVASGESGFDSSADSGQARGRTQFTPGSRATVLQKFGVDPWGSVDEAYHAAALHLRGKVNGSKGLEGYNPGDPSYTGYILGQKVGHTRGASSDAAGGGSAGLPGVPGTQGARNQPMGSTGALALLKALQEPRQAPASSGLQTPAFAAAPALPKGYEAPVSGGGPAAPPDVNALLDQIRTVGGDVQLAPGAGAIPGLAGVTGGFGSTQAGRLHGGRVVVRPNADRPGVHTHQAVIDFARQVSAVAGLPVSIGRGTRHDRLTTNGRVSDHWSGNAADLPATGRRLIRLGQAALIAAGMPEREARRQHGGLYNVGGHQIIFNVNDPALGGDHTDHLHISARRGHRRGDAAGAR
jgi:hypothetical protein